MSVSVIMTMIVIAAWLFTPFFVKTTAVHYFEAWFLFFRSFSHSLSLVIMFRRCIFARYGNSCSGIAIDFFTYIGAGVGQIRQ